MAASISTTVRHKVRPYDAIHSALYKYAGNHATFLVDTKRGFIDSTPKVHTNCVKKHHTTVSRETTMVNHSGPAAGCPRLI